MLKRVGRHPYWRCCTVHQIAHLKPSEEFCPGAHVVAEQQSMKSKKEQLDEVLLTRLWNGVVCDALKGQPERTRLAAVLRFVSS